MRNFRLKFTPMGLYLPFRVQRLPTRGPRSTKIVRPHSSIPNKVISKMRHERRFTTLGNRFQFQQSTLPTIRSMRPARATQLSTIKIRQLKGVNLPNGRSRPNNATMRATPFRSNKGTPARAYTPFGSARNFRLVKDNVLRIMPLPRRVVRRRNCSILRRPILPMRTIRRHVITYRTNRKVTYNFRQALATMARPRRQIKRDVRHRNIQLYTPNKTTLIAPKRTRASGRTKGLRGDTKRPLHNHSPLQISPHPTIRPCHPDNGNRAHPASQYELYLPRNNT